MENELQSIVLNEILKRLEDINERLGKIEKTIALHDKINNYDEDNI